MRCARGAACQYAEDVEGVRVGGLIHPGEAWDLGHADGESVGGVQPSCRRVEAEPQDAEVEDLVSGHRAVGAPKPGWPYLVYAVRRLLASRRPYRCPTCGEAVTT